MKLEGTDVLVTGAGGFIGSHLTEALVRLGARVRAFVRYNSTDSRGWLDHVSSDISADLEFFPGDIRDSLGVRTAMKGCDAVFHLAALIGIPYSYHSPDAYLETNARGTLNVVQAGRELGVGRILHTSTSEVYGSARFVPITEEHPLQGQSPYSATKIAADHIALSYHRSFDTPVAVVRPFNAYGPRQSARAVIPTVIVQLLADSRRLRLGATAPTRDFNFVADTVNGFLKVAQSDATVGEVINLGSGYEISIGETARLIAGILGSEVEIETEVERLRPGRSEVNRLLADATKARELAGWQPALGGREGFEAGLKTTVEWFRDPANRASYRPGTYTI